MPNQPVGVRTTRAKYVRVGKRPLVRAATPPPGGGADVALPAVLGSQLPFVLTRKGVAVQVKEGEESVGHESGRKIVRPPGLHAKCCCSRRDLASGEEHS